jgi:predicted  nucleic acid-binding Zn-ribbon protein
MSAMAYYHCPACGSSFHSASQKLVERCDCGHALDFSWMPAGPPEPDRRAEGALGAAGRRFRRGRRSAAPV